MKVLNFVSNLNGDIDIFRGCVEENLHGCTSKGGVEIGKSHLL